MKALYWRLSAPGSLFVLFAIPSRKLLDLRFLKVCCEVLRCLQGLVWCGFWPPHTSPYKVPCDSHHVMGALE
jgi:hypothetical protein